MNVPADLPAGPPRSHREQAEADLQIALWVLIALTCALLPVWYLLSAPVPAQDVETFPVGTSITDTAALALDDAEAERFDSDVFGTPERPEPNALGDLRLPPKVPVLADRLWLPPQSSELASRQARDALAAFERCTELVGCDPRQGGLLSAALAAVSQPAASAQGPCDVEPRTSPGAIQVPTGLTAIVLAWMPECSEQALAQFQAFRVIVEKNIRSHNLPPPYSDAARVYAQLAIAKLQDLQRQPGSPELVNEMRAIRKEILSRRVLRQHYEKLDEVPKWGLSMAEIHAEWLMAEARQMARAGRGRGLARRLRPLLGPDPDVLEELPSDSNQSPGQSRLQLAWCALALRADIPEGVSDTCLDTLASARSFPSLHCAVVARIAIRSGLWDRWPRLDTDCSSEKEGSPEESARGLLARLAGTPKVWTAALRHYLDRGIDESERASLQTYLDTHASQSTLDTLLWLAVQHPWGATTAVCALILLLAGWAALAWAYFIRRPTLYRFLPPRLQADNPS